MSRLPEMSKEEFCAHMADANFPEMYGNPALIKGAQPIVCMSQEHYDHLIWQRDRLRDLAELRREEDVPDGETEYWVYELEMPEEDLSRMKQIAAAEGVSLNEYMCLTLMAGNRWCENASEWEKQLLRDACNNVEYEPIKICNSYPVRKGQTEAEAREKENHHAKGNSI